MLDVDRFAIHPTYNVSSASHLASLKKDSSYTMSCRVEEGHLK